MNAVDTSKMQYWQSRDKDSLIRMILLQEEIIIDYEKYMDDKNKGDKK